jgi:flagellar protein FlaJ
MLANEMQEIYKKVQLRVPIGKAIIETNNKYRIPRLARIFRIIKSAQDVSDNITKVLSTAADLAETQKEIIDERKTRTRQQIGIIIVIFLVFLACVVLMNFFLLNDIIAMGASSGGATSQFSGEPIESSTIELMFFHGALIQGILGGLTAGYIRTGEFTPGMKYSLLFSTVVMVVWTVTRGIFA